MVVEVRFIGKLGGVGLGSGLVGLWSRTLLRFCRRIATAQNPQRSWEGQEESVVEGWVGRRARRAVLACAVYTTVCL
jgi:hypothetical protein